MLLLPLPLLIDDAVEVTGELLSPTFCEFSQAFRAHSILNRKKRSILLFAAFKIRFPFIVEAKINGTYQF